ncbi:MAG: DUF4835 family protein [Bacteroidota bacterium]
MKKIFSILLLLSAVWAEAQELNCKVQILSPSIQTSPADKQTLESLQQQIFDLLNNTKWTTEAFKTEEKIECNIIININEHPSQDEYGGTIQVSSSRTAFNSNYSSTVFNYVDENFKFSYQRNTPFIFSIDIHRSNITSVIAFYAYMIIAYDYDTYSPEGGTKYFVKAQQIVNNAQSAAEPGWRAAEGERNRYWLVDNHLHQVYKPLRQAFYKYHRLGFDKMYEDVAVGRKAVLESLELIQQVATARPGSFNVQLFFSAKVTELVNLFSGAPEDEKMKGYNLCKKMDPGNSTKYQQIIKKN